jgi:hypothetical protein
VTKSKIFSNVERSPHAADEESVSEDLESAGFQWRGWSESVWESRMSSVAAGIPVFYPSLGLSA